MNTVSKTLKKEPIWIRILHHTGAPVTAQFSMISEIFVLFGQALRRLFVRPWRWKEIGHQISQIGVASLPIVVISTSFAGMVLTTEVAWHMNRALHTVEMIPGFTGQFILRELGVAIPALLIVSKVGAAITAEVGTMKVTEQIDALKLLGIDPINYLVFPRLIATTVSGACLVVIAVGVTMACAIGVAVFRYHFSVLEYLNALRHFIGLSDLFGALIKATVYGAVVPIISCAYGFKCKGGAEGVGTATTNSVVASTIAIILLDFVLTYLFTLIF